jgi:Asp-tRNA(Asn)/Glu-tRNA(Gln) amidotransferase A subunit family amidase
MADGPTSIGPVHEVAQMAFKEYGNFDAVGLAELVRNKQVTSRELLEEAIARTAKVDPQINAVVVGDYDDAVRHMSGQPAMSVPLAWNKAGLPLGMMFSARFGDEATLFRVAGQFEQARPWKNQIPPVSA